MLACLMILSLISSPIFSDFKLHSFDSSVSVGPILYENSFFYVDSSHQLIKLASDGQKDWTVSLDSQSIKELYVSFNSVFVVDRKGQLTVYDSDYGYRIWGPKSLNIRQLVLHYPLVIVLSNDGYLSAIDFFSGQYAWSNQSNSWDHLLFDVQNGEFHVSNSSGVSTRDMFSGDQVDFQKMGYSISLKQVFSSRLLTKPVQIEYSFYQQLQSNTNVSESLTYRQSVHNKSLFVRNKDLTVVVKDSGSLETVTELSIPLNSVSQFVEPFADYVSFIYDGGIKILSVGDTKESLFTHDTMTKKDFIKAVHLENKFYLFFKDRYLVWQDN